MVDGICNSRDLSDLSDRDEGLVFPFQDFGDYYEYPQISRILTPASRGSEENLSTLDEVRRAVSPSQDIEDVYRNIVYPYARESVLKILRDNDKIACLKDDVFERVFESITNYVLSKEKFSSEELVQKFHEATSNILECPFEPSHIKSLTYYKIKFTFHPFRVLEVGRKIMDRVGLTDNQERRNLEYALLLHDVGTFKNHRDHDYSGYKILKSKGFVDAAVLLAVKYHSNVKNECPLKKDPMFIALNAGEKNRAKLFFHVLQDSDRIANLQATFEEQYDLVKNKEKQSFDLNDSFLEKMEEGNIVPFRSEGYYNSLVSYCSWCMQIHLKESLEIVREEDVVKNMIKGIYEGYSEVYRDIDGAEHVRRNSFLEKMETVVGYCAQKRLLNCRIRLGSESQGKRQGCHLM